MLSKVLKTAENNAKEAIKVHIIGHPHGHASIM